MKLTDHFVLDELTVSQSAARLGLSNKPDKKTIENLKRLCILLEEIRSLYGKPLVISSGYRSPQVNKIVGGSATSQHLKGQAADFTIPSVSLKTLMKKIYQSNIVYDQLILEFDSWIHISWSEKPRKQALVINSKGTSIYK